MPIKIPKYIATPPWLLIKKNPNLNMYKESSIKKNKFSGIFFIVYLELPQIAKIMRMR